MGPQSLATEGFHILPYPPIFMPAVIDFLAIHLPNAPTRCKGFGVFFVGETVGGKAEIDCPLTLGCPSLTLGKMRKPLSPPSLANLTNPGPYPLSNPLYLPIR